MNVSPIRRCAIEFLNAEEPQLNNINKRLVNVYGGDGKTVDVSTVR